MLIYESKYNIAVLSLSPKINPSSIRILWNFFNDEKLWVEVEVEEGRYFNVESSNWIKELTSDLMSKSSSLVF